MSIKKSSVKDLLKKLEKRTEKIKDYIDRIQVSKDLRRSLKKRADDFQKTIKTILKNENKVAPVSSLSAAASSRASASAEKPFGDPYIRSLVNDPSAAEYVALWRRLAEMKSSSTYVFQISFNSFLEEDKDHLRFTIDAFFNQNQIAFAGQLASLPIDDSNREAVHCLESIIQAQDAQNMAAIRKYLWAP